MLDQIANPDDALLARLRQRGASLPPPAQDEGIELDSAQLFEDRNDPSGAKPGSDPAIARSTHPMREMAAELRAELRDFIQTNMVAPTRMGFMSTGHEPVGVDKLVKSCDDLAKKLDAIISDNSTPTPETFTHRGIAIGMQANVEEFLLALTKRSSTEGLNESEMEPTLHAAIALKQQLSASMLQMDAIGAGFQIG